MADKKAVHDGDAVAETSDGSSAHGFTNHLRWIEALDFLECSRHLLLSTWDKDAK
ncbi:MAG: hypothetical protein GXX83_04830 [Gaiellales bacterium]|nr:hypothetical protein [Gaiellales bacterium]